VVRVEFSISRLVSPWDEVGLAAEVHSIGN
jgi:hypothetical protein